MRCPECGANGYSRKTMTPEWRCRKCGHEWDESNPSHTRPYSPVGSNRIDKKDPWFVWVLVLAGFFVVSFVVLYVLYLTIGLFLGTILGGEIPVMVALGVGLLVYIVWGLAHDGSSTKKTMSGVVMLLSILPAYALLFYFIAWGTCWWCDADRPPSDPGEQCSVRDKGGRIKDYCW